LKSHNARLSHDERNADRLVEHQPLVVAAVLAQEIAVVARVEHERIIINASQHSADAVVESFQGPQIVRDELRVGPASCRIGQAPVREDVDAAAARRALHERRRLGDVEAPQRPDAPSRVKSRRPREPLVAWRIVERLVGLLEVRFN